MPSGLLLYRPQDLLNSPTEKLLVPYVTIRCPETVYSTAWYPYSTLSDCITFCYLSAARDHPIHLYDGLTGMLRASYPLINHVEKFTAPYAMQFSMDGESFFAGTDSLISQFSLNQPGPPVVSFKTSLRDYFAQKGPISALALSADILAAGSVSGQVGLYDPFSNSPVSVFDTIEKTGVTQVLWSADEKLLFVASRRSDCVEIWDVRSTGCILGKLTGRKANTNQRMSINLKGDTLVAGGTDGQVRCWNIKSFNMQWQYQLHNDPVTGATMHPTCAILASCSGKRYFGETVDFSMEMENTLKIFDCRKDSENALF
ncbi:Guanine nucleotide-binding protein negative regulator 1 [Neolecta irregularis DAH-3]|uniref:Guanine nucleotide-binding protein negative regulator 1 n=1 Tax=Neolecta irregularis (strain DAH-3) TaxID=1198029 RepID=A0A1U7LMF8_NEOID|nr:Guanine nucleotide-binding protein negative regulator 1 [Neolecta irregularis DAH-3]|eukprot:OLL23818.1 Guanine nucleotide-binding protein negative regulator 1 [Neolecta irregularis DAH-3]